MKTYTVRPGQNETHVADLIDSENEFEFIVNKNAVLTLVLTSIQADQVNAKVTVRLAGAGSAATIVGIVVAGGDSRIKLHTLQSHEAPETTSNLLVKTALAGSAVCSIDGGIRVEKSAQKTDAYQRNENILLSGTAHAESKPSLEILANDVRCTHGATVGPVSEEEVWYLATRGISKPSAQSLIVNGFFRKAIDLIADVRLKESLWKSIEGAL